MAESHPAADHPAAPLTDHRADHLADALPDPVAGATVDEAVFALRPDYRVVLLAVDGLEPGPSDAVGEALLRRAEASARELLAERRVEDVEHVAAWRQAYRSFGAKPQRTRNSLESLMRRAASGLPRVNRLTDLYNAISVLHRIPLGGEDLMHYVGPPWLIRSTGTEPFATTADGVSVIETPPVGEVVWCDDAGVTCRRWNWRQSLRTRLREDTTAALFILDVLEPVTDAAALAAAAELLDQLPGRALRTTQRLIGRPHPHGVRHG